MAYVRRHWLSSTLSVFVILMGLTIALTPTMFSGGTLEEARAQAAIEPAEPESVDPYLWTRVQKLRQELALTTMDLAAMGCDEETAAQVLTGLKSWCETNQASLDQHHREELQARAALREAIRLINVGTDDPGISRSLPGLRQDLAGLYEQQQTMFGGLVTQLETHLDAYQRGVWRNARDNAGLPAQLRYLSDLTDQQRQAIHNKLADRSSQASLSDVAASELTWSQKQAIDSVRVNATLKTDAIRSAEAAVLPVPELLKQDFEAAHEELPG